MTAEDFGAEFDRLSAPPGPQDDSTAPEALGESIEAPAPESEPADSVESQRPVEESPLYPAALADVEAMDGAAPSDTTIMQAIRGNGGIRTRNADGSLTPEGGDLMSVIGDNPGHVMNLVNNNTRAIGVQGSAKRVGWPPDLMTERLKEQRWLPPDADTNDLMDLIDRSVNRGETIYHPESEIGPELEYRKLLTQEFDEAGVTSLDSREEAAAKLTRFRETQGAHFTDQEFHGITGDEDELPATDLKELQSDDDWIGSDEWLARESAEFADPEPIDSAGYSDGNEDAAGGVSQAGAVRQDLESGTGRGDAAGEPHGGAGEVSGVAARAVNVVSAKSRYADLTPREALDRALKDAPRGTFTNEDTGWNIEVARQGIRKSLQGDGSKVRAEIVSNLPELIRNAVLDDSHPHEGPASDRISVVHRFYAPFELDGRTNAVKLTVREYAEGGLKHYAVEHAEMGRPDAFGELAPPGGSAATSAVLRSGESSGPTRNLGDLRDTINRARSALDDARTASSKFGRGQEPSTIAPPDAGERAEAQVNAAVGDNIDELLAADEQRVADLHSQGAISDEDLKTVSEANSADEALAKSNGDAAKAAARCLWLHA